MKYRSYLGQAHFDGKPLNKIFVKSPVLHLSDGDWNNCDTPKFLLGFYQKLCGLRRDLFKNFLFQKNLPLKNLLLPWQGFYFFQTLVVDLLQTTSLLVPSKKFFLGVLICFILSEAL